MGESSEWCSIRIVQDLRKKIYRLLRWSEKYTKTDMVYLTKGSFWLGLGYIIQVASGLIIAAAFANFLPKETFGTYQFILSTAGILSVFTLSGMGTAITRAVAQGNDGVLRSGFRTKLTWNVGITLASAAVALYYFINGNNELAVGFLIVGSFAPFIEGFNLYQQFLVGKEHFKESVLLGAWRKPIPIIALLSTLYFTHSPIVLVLIYFVSNTLSLGMLYWIVLKRYQPPHVDDADTVRYSKHLSMITLFTRAGQHADKILLFSLLGPAAVATFTIAQLPVKYARDGLNTLRSLMLPKLSQRNFSTLQKALPRKVFLFSLAISVLSLLYILVTPFIYRLIFPTYPESILFSQALAISLLFLPRSAYIQALTAHKKKSELYIISSFIPIIKISLLIVFIKLYGIWGAVSAIIASEIISSILIKVMFTRGKTNVSEHLS